MEKEILSLFRPSSSVSNTLAELLEFEGYKIHQSDNPIELLKQVNSFEYLPCSLIILEIKMPKVDGVELFERMMKYKVKIPIILMSGHLSEENGIKYEKVGLFKYIALPPDVYDFVRTVKEAISLYEANI